MSLHKQARLELLGLEWLGKNVFFDIYYLKKVLPLLAILLISSNFFSTLPIKDSKFWNPFISFVPTPNSFACFSVNSNYFPKSIFQGFIGCIPEHPIIYEGLKNIYLTDNSALIEKPQNFHDICRNMYVFVSEYPDKTKIKLYEEIFGNNTTANIVDLHDNRLILKHYHINKIIPKSEFTS